MSPLNTLAALSAAFCLISGSQAWAAPVEIIPAKFHGAAQPQVTVAPDGRIHVAFGMGLGVYHAASKDGGRTFSEPVRVAEIPKLALGLRRGPRVTATNDVVTVSAISHAEGSLLAWTSKDGGATWSQATQINSVPKSAREGLHAMAGDGKGFVILTWLDMRNHGMELWSVTSRDGGLSWSENAQVYKSPDGNICQCCHPSVAVGPQGRVAAMWRNWVNGSRDMYVSLSNDGGKTWDQAQKIGHGTWKLKACPMDGGAVTFLGNGQPHTVWRREKTVFRAGLNEAEEKIADAALQPVVFNAQNGLGLIWQQGNQLWLKRNNGVPAVLAENGMFAAVAERPGHGPVVVWEAPKDGSKTLMAEVLE